MSRRRFVALLLVAILGIGAAYYFSSRRDRAPDTTTGTPLLPSLAGGIAAVDGVTIRRGSTASVELRRDGALWTVAERDGYPADTPKLRRLLLSLADTRVIEEKTANPANYASIGVEDPASPGATSTEVSLKLAAPAPGGADAHAAAPAAAHATLVVIIGKSAGDGSFVRLAGSARSELVAPGISVETDPHYWIDPSLLDVPVATITALQVHPAAGPAYSLRRTAPDADFVLSDVPTGRTALGSKALAPSPMAFGNLTIEDVAPAASVDFSAPDTATLSLSDGNVLILRGSAVGDKRWLTVESSKDAALSAKTRGHAYALAAYRYDAIFRPLEQLLQPKSAPARPASSAPQGSPPRPQPPPQVGHKPSQPPP
jgi:hypothetical protein